VCSQGKCACDADKFHKNDNCVPSKTQFVVVVVVVLVVFLGL